MKNLVRRKMKRLPERFTKYIYEYLYYTNINSAEMPLTLHLLA